MAGEKYHDYVRFSPRWDGRRELIVSHLPCQIKSLPLATIGSVGSFRVSLNVKQTANSEPTHSKRFVLGVYCPHIEHAAQTKAPATCLCISRHRYRCRNPRPHPPPPRRFYRYVPDLHCYCLNFQLSNHLRQCYRSLQEENQEKSPFPSTTPRTPDL